MGNIAIGRLKTEMLALHIAQALRQQACSRKQHERQRRLRNHERFLRPAAAASAGTAGAAKRVGRSGVRRDPCRCNSKKNSGQQRDRERESQHGQRRRGVDRYIGHRERETKDQVRSTVGDRYARNSSEHRQNDAFGEHLADLARRRRAECGSNGSLQLPSGGADKQQVGDVRARDCQNERGNPHEEVKAGEIFVTQLPNAGTARRQAKRLLGNSIALSRLKLGDGTEEPLLQFHLHVRADLLWISAGSDPADDVEPILLRKIDNRAGTVNERLGGNRNPEGGGISKAVAKERGRRDADHGERLAVQSYRASDNRGIAAELLLPRAIADHRDRRRAFAIVVGGNDPAGVRANAEHGEVISGNEFASHRTRRLRWSRSGARR